MADFETFEEYFTPEGQKLSLGQNIENGFKYSALSYLDSIRVFVLEPSLDATTPVYGEIVEHRLYSDSVKQDYTAFSYAWSGEKYAHEIYIGNDVSERNHQVQQMRMIYSSAFETVIYLGGETGGNTQLSAWNFLERHAGWAMNSNRDADSGRPAEVETLTDFHGELSDVEIDVFTRPWFKRLWVFQEVIVSNALSIQCGSWRISWDDFCKILLLTSRHADRYGFSLEGMEKLEIVRDMFQARCTYQELYCMDQFLPVWRFQVPTYKHETLDILNLLQRTRFQLEASDPRDKIFGLLGISSGIDVDDQDFAIDYNQDCRTVYTRFTRNLIRVTESYDILSYLDHGLMGDYGHLGPIVNKHRLPSWVPDWDLSKWSDWSLRNARTILSTLPSGSNIERSESCQSFNKCCGWLDSGDSGDTLVARGYVIGKIDHVSYRILVSGSFEINFQEILDSGLREKDREDLIRRIWVNILCRNWDNRANETFAQVGVNFLDEKIYDRWFSTKRCSENGTVQRHILARSRKTAPWAYDRLVLPSAIVDKTSIVDGKRLAVYSLFGRPYIKTLAIFPAEAREGDFLIDLKGGRVPFTIRIQDEPLNPKIDFGFRDCRLIGESVVNREIVDEPIWRERVFLIH